MSEGRADSAPGHEAGLSDWLAWLESGAGSAIDLGLDRLRPVCRVLGIDRPGFRVLTVAGTNGKGSSVALAEQLLLAGGHRVGAYTSPHLIAFNERIRLDGRPVDDETIVAAFRQIEAARGDARLTYFEYTTLAALLVFRDAGVSDAVLEVGLGGRLDAVNCIDADVALLTRVALDHAEWLGNDLAGIAREKAGVCRPGRPAVVADDDPDSPLPAAAEATGATVHHAARDFGWRDAGDGNWEWHGPGGRHLTDLPSEPAWRVDWQRQNAAGALMAVSLLRPDLLEAPERVATAFGAAGPAGRVQRFPGPPETLLDVAHNPDAAAALRVWLTGSPVRGRTRAVIGMRADKDIDGVVRALAPAVDEWWPADLSASGGLDATALAGRLGSATTAGAGDEPMAAWRSAVAASSPDDRVLVLGSFMTVGPVLRELDRARHTGN